jgi:hypothetical protein
VSARGNSLQKARGHLQLRLVEDDEELKTWRRQHLEQWRTALQHAQTQLLLLPELPLHPA